MLSPRARNFWLLAIFVVAFLFRLVVIDVLGKKPVRDLIWNDAVAWNLAQGIGFTASQHPPYVPGIFRTPGFPAFLAVVYRIAGHNYRAGFVALALLDSLTAVLTALLAAELLPLPVALLAGLLYALYPYAAYFCGFLSQDIPLVFATILTLLLLVRAVGQPARTSLWVWVGIGVGMAMWIKPFLGVMGFVVVATLLASRLPFRSVVRYTALVGVVAAVSIAPWVWRNYRVFGSFPPLAVGGTGSGLQYLQEELESGEQHFANLRPEFNSTDAEYLDAFVDGQALIDLEREQARATVPEMRRMWKRYIVVYLIHIVRLWYTRHTLYDSPAVTWAAKVLSLLLLIPGAVGIWMLRRRWREFMPLLATIAVLTLAYSLYHVEARYTLPARPVMIIFATYCVAALAARATSKLSWLRPDVSAQA